MNSFSLKVLLSLVLAGLPTLAFSGCDWDAGEPRPDWVNNPDYVLPGYTVSVGVATRDGRTHDEQRAAAENDARKNLVQQIQVTIKAEDSVSTQVNSQTVSKSGSSKVTVTSEEDLQGLKTKSFWVDKQSCSYYTLLTISAESIAKSKNRSLMKTRLAKFKESLGEGTNDNKNRDIKQRRKYLEDAQGILPEIDFSLLPEELGRAIYAQRLAEAMAQLNKESSKAKGRMALFALNEDHTLKADVLGRMLDQLRSGDIPTVRLMADCTSQQECMDIAKDLGYTMLTMLTISSEITTSQMGSLKGTLTVIKTVYDIESRKAVKASDKASTQVIGWSREELDWGAAAEKAMQNFK